MTAFYLFSKKKIFLLKSLSQFKRINRKNVCKGKNNLKKWLNVQRKPKMDNRESYEEVLEKSLVFVTVLCFVVV